MKIFRQGVQQQFKLLAGKEIATVATVDGRTVRAVPQKVGAQFVLVAPVNGAKRVRH